MFSDLSDFDRQAVALALYRMLTGKSYDISPVRGALRTCGRLADNVPGFATLRLHHCAAFAEMPPGFHASVVQATLALFAGAPPMGDDLLRALAATAGLDSQDAPRLLDLDATHARTLPPAHSGDGQVGTAPAFA